MNSTRAFTDITTNHLESSGWDDIAMLRKAAASLSEPTELAELLGIEIASFNQLVTPPDLKSLQGLGDTYIELLRHMGIVTVVDLCDWDPFELHAAVKIAVREHRVGRVPNRATLEDWIEQAQAIMVCYR